MDTKKYILFSDYIKENDIELFKNKNLFLPYCIGAYCEAIIDASYTSKISRKNITFKKWLSNQPIRHNNLLKIFNKAMDFQKKLQLGSQRNEDLSTLVTDNYDMENTCADSKKITISQQEVHFMFTKGFNDYKKFKKENKIEKEEVTNE